MTESYPGQQGLGDDGSAFNATSFLVKQLLGRVRTATLVKVIAVHSGGGALATAGSVDVQPLVNQLDGSGNATPHATIFGLVYSRMQGGVNAVIIDPAVGDIGVAIISDRDISSVKASTGKQANPGSLRRFDLADSIYLGGLLNAVPTQYWRFFSGGMEAVDSNANKISMTATGISINGVLFNRTGQIQGNLPVTGSLQLAGPIQSLAGASYANDFSMSGNITATGAVQGATVVGTTDVTGGGKNLSSHRHTGVSAGGAITGPPQ